MASLMQHQKYGGRKGVELSGKEDQVCLNSLKECVRLGRFRKSIRKLGLIRYKIQLQKILLVFLS